MYTCAYFGSTDESLETAQLRKLDLVCQKLRLRPGERLLDIDCGWGALVQHAAQRYDVNAVGITLSRTQAEFANERIRVAGLAGRCRVEVIDYRELDEAFTYDKVASVCMFEQVREDLLEEYFAKMRKLLRHGGMFLNQGIARNVDFAATARTGGSFIDRWVFPDHSLSPISTALAAAERAGFELRDVESLREHYVLTLNHWLRAARGEPRRGSPGDRRDDVPCMASLYGRVGVLVRAESD